MRLDAAVAKQLSTTRAHAKQLILGENVSYNGKLLTKPSMSVENDIYLDIILPKKIRPSIELEVLYEDDDIKVINKPAGMLVHPTSAHQSEPTVVDAIRHQTTDDDAVRPGIVHRLDRNTSGLMILAKSKKAKDYMQAQFAKRNVQKTYIALVVGHLNPEEAIINVPLARSKTHPLQRVADPSGKIAETHYKVIESRGDFDLIETKPKTGRTHQLRAHFAYLGHPIVGDKLYGAPADSKLGRYFLHAQRLQFTAPNGTKVDVVAELPAALKRRIMEL